MLDLERTPRPLQRYEWLILLLCAGHAAGAHGEVYKCTDAQGAATFQDRPCAASADQAVVALAPVPAYSPSPAYSAGDEAGGRGARRTRQRPGATPRRDETAGASSYECRTSDGQVFYRHSACPHSVAALDQGNSAHRGRGAGAKSTASKSVAVTSMRVPREDACYELRRAGAASRRGRDHDQDVSTYDKNLGRDPCR